MFVLLRGVGRLLVLRRLSADGRLRVDVGVRRAPDLWGCAWLLRASQKLAVSDVVVLFVVSFVG